MTDEEEGQALPLLAQVQHLRLQDTGHFIFGPEKEPLLRVVLDFLESVSDRRTR